MRRVVVIGATGHIGTYLVPRLVRAGYEVVAVSRGERQPYHDAVEWRSVARVTADRDVDDAAGTFGSRIADLEPDAVVDLICFTPESARYLVDALRPARPLLVHCGTIWVHGRTARVPVTEDEPRTAYGGYGIGKAAIEALLHRETLAGGVPSVVLHPGHICGPGWPVITPAGNLDADVWRRLAVGEPVALPALGLGVLHHVHADDVAQAFEKACATGGDWRELPRRGRAGDDLPRASPGSRRIVSSRGYSRLRRLGRVRAVCWRVARCRDTRSRRSEYRGQYRTLPIDPGDAPRYSSLDALRESLRWLVHHSQVDVSGQAF